MADFICPQCRGGFPEEHLGNDRDCPWCHFKLGDAMERFDTANWHPPLFED